MGRFRLFVALVLGLAMAVGVAQEKTATEAPTALPTEAEPAAREPVPGRSNPFAPLDEGGVRRPRPQESPLARKAGEVPPPPAARVSLAEGLKLNGILYCDAMPLAVVNNLIVRVGDEAGGMRVKTIEPSRVLLEDADGFYVMTPLNPAAGRGPGAAAAPRRAPGGPAPVAESAESEPDVAPAAAKTEAGEEDAQGTADASLTRDPPMGKENP